MAAIYRDQHIISISIICVSYRRNKSLELAVSSDLVDVASWRRLVTYDGKSPRNNYPYPLYTQ